MKTLKLLIKRSFFNKINDFLCFDIIKYIFGGISNKVCISYIIKNQHIQRGCASLLVGTDKYQRS